MSEFILSYVENIKNTLIMLGIFWAGFVVISYAIARDDTFTVYESEKEKKTKARGVSFLRAKYTLMALPIYILIVCVPSMDDIWKTRIALIKYNLASPENINKASDEIVKIGKKLECKYLEICKDEK